DPIIFEGARERHGKRNGLSQHHSDRLGIGMARQNLVEQRAEPHQPPTQTEGVDLERLDEIVAQSLGHQDNTSPAPPTMRALLKEVTKTAAARQAKHQVKMPFCAWSRFSASSHTTDCGPSITPADTSAPRLAGKQCMKMASGFALAISRSSTRYGVSMLWRLRFASTPIDTQVSATTQSAPA